MIINSKKLIAAAVLLVFLLNGCANRAEAPIDNTVSPGIAEDEPVASPDTPTRQDDGTLKLYMRAPKTLNPLLNEDITVDAVLKLIFLPLVKLDESEKPVHNDAFVQSINIAEDGMGAVVKLKYGKKWSDGQEIKAEDLAFSISTLLSAPDTVVYKEMVKNMLSPEIIDDYTVKINFMQPFAEMRYLLRFPIIPRHYYLNETGQKSEKNLQPVGNGPYVLDHYVLAETVALTASPYNFTEPKPNINNINIIILNSENSEFYAFDSGKTDVVAGLISNGAKYMVSNEYNTSKFVSTYYDYIGFNFNKPVFQDKHVREAIAYSVPYDEIMKDVYANYAVRTNTPIKPGSWLYEENSKSRGFNLEMAEQALSDGGWKEDRAKGVLTKPLKGIDERVATLSLAFSILVNSENEARVKMADMIKENLNSLGMDVRIISVNYEDFQQRLINRNFDICIGGYNLSPIPELSFMLNSANAGTGTNYYDYKDAAMDLLLSNAFNASGEENYKKAMSELQKYIAEELPCISIAFRESVVVLNKRVQGDIKPSFDNIYQNINEWVITE